MGLAWAMLILIALTAMASFAVDYGRVQLVKNELQSTADAAALYGAAGLWQNVGEVKSRVAAVGRDNKVDGQPLTIDTNNDLEFGQWDAATRTFNVLTGYSQSSANAVRVTTRRAQARGTGVRTTFASILGQETVDVHASAVAGFGSAIDVQIVQDITGSFAEEIADAKTGDKALIDALYAGGTSRAKIGVSVFTGWGKTLLAPVPLSSNYSQISSTINSIQLGGGTGMPPRSGTDIATGLEEALKTFAAAPASSAQKTVVLVSDGEPNADRSGAHPYYSNAMLLALAQQRANDLWAKKIHVYVVFFNRDNNQLSAAQLASLSRGNGYFVQVTDPKQLPVALAQLGRRLPVQLLK